MFVVPVSDPLCLTPCSWFWCLTPIFVVLVSDPMCLTPMFVVPVSDPMCLTPNGCLAPKPRFFLLS
jgi:hypothetical protein